MCYGQTGAGKTFTMTGATENYKHRGLIPRSLAQVYKEIEERPETAITVRYISINIQCPHVCKVIPHRTQSVPPPPLHGIYGFDWTAPHKVIWDRNDLIVLM